MPKNTLSLAILCCIADFFWNISAVSQSTESSDLMSYVFSLTCRYLFYLFAGTYIATLHTSSTTKYILREYRMCHENVCMKNLIPGIFYISNLFCTSIHFIDLKYTLEKQWAYWLPNMSSSLQNACWNEGRINCGTASVEKIGWFSPLMLLPFISKSLQTLETEKISV